MSKSACGRQGCEDGWRWVVVDGEPEPEPCVWCEQAARAATSEEAGRPTAAALILVGACASLAIMATVLLWTAAQSVSATERCASDYDRCVIALVED